MGFGKDGKGTIILETNIITAGTLADGTALLADGGITLAEDFRILKSEVFVGINEDIAVGDGPIYFGVANGELSIAEIAEVMVQTGPSNRNDAARSEQALRKVEILAVFGPANSNSSGAGDQKWKGPIVTKPRWTYSDPEGWNYFIFNQSGGALVTGNIFRYRAKHYGVWVT